MEEETELTTIDVDNMAPHEQDIYHRRMKVLDNLFAPTTGDNPRISYEALADEENVDKRTIDRDVTWLKKTYPSLWNNAQVKSEFAFSMLKISKRYSAMIDRFWDRFWGTTDLDEQLKIAKALNDLMPTYTNSKSYGVILEKIKSTVKDETKIN